MAAPNEAAAVCDLPADRPRSKSRASTAMRVDFRSFRTHATRFMRWWLSELAALLPQKLRRLCDLNSQQITIEFNGDEVTVSLLSKGVRSVLGTSPIDLTNKMIGDNDLARLVESIDKDTDTLLCLQDHQALATTVSLPIDALENIREVLGYEIERRTPFKANQVYFDYDVAEHHSQPHQLNVRLVVVPRRYVDEAAEFAHQWGFHPSAATIVENGSTGPSPRKAESLNFLPADRRWKTSGSWTLLNRLLAISAIGLTVAATLIPLAQQDAVIAGLESRIADLKTDAEASQALRGELDRLIPESRFFANLKNQSVAAIDVLNELSLVLPDDTWLQRLQLSGSALNLQGESAAASRLIALMENSIMFRHATFSTVVARDTRSGRERFQITAEVTIKQPR